MAIIDVVNDFNFEVIRGSKFLTTRGKCTVTTDGVDDVNEEPFLVEAAVGVPQHGDVHPGNTSIFLQRKTVVRTSPHYFEIDLFYSSIEYTEISGPGVLPWEQEEVISYFTVTTSEPIDKAYEDPSNPNTLKVHITNSAGEPPDPPIVEDFIEPGVRIKWNIQESSFNPQDIASYYGRVNKETFHGYPAGTVRCMGIVVEPAYYGSTKYYRLVAEYHIHIDGWKRKFVDEGYVVKKAASGLYYNILDGENGRPGVSRILALADDAESFLPISEPAKLDGEGQLLAAGADTKFREFNTKLQVSFSGLA